MPLVNAPGIRFEAVDANSQRIAALRTDVAGFAGICERGPLGVPVRAGSWEQFRSAFGNLAPNALLPWAIKAFFENGGRTCWIVRVAAPLAATTTTGPQPASRLSSIVLNADAFAAGGVATLTQPTVTTSAPTPAQPADRQASIVVDGSGFTARATVSLSQTTTTTTDPAATQPADRRTSLVVDAHGFTAGALVQVDQPGQSTTHRLLANVDDTTHMLVWDTPLDAAYDPTQPLTFRTTLRDVRGVARVDTNTINWTVPLDARFDLARAIDFRTVATAERLIAAVSGTTIDWTRAYGDEFDPSRPIDVATGASAASGTLLDATGLPALRVEAASPGAWGNGVSVVTSRTNRRATRSAGPQPADGVFSVVESVAGLAAGTVMQIFQPGRRSVHRVVASIDAARKRIVWREPLVNLDFNHPFSLESEEWTISVYERGTLREVLDGLTLVPGDDRHYAPAVVNRASRFIRLTDLASPAPPPLSHPVPQPLALGGGRDGLAALRAGDVMTGLAALELVDEVSFLAVPDILIERVPAIEVLPDPSPLGDPCSLRPADVLPASSSPSTSDHLPPTIREQSAQFSLADVLRVQNAMIEQCERLHDRMALLDPPNFRPVEAAEIESWRKRFESKYAALYFPWIVVLDPQNRRELTRAIPPSGHVAGIWARSDLATGVHKAPANEELRWAQDVTIAVSEGLHEILNPLGINAIRLFPACGLRVYGARTVSSDSSWRYVNVRRLMIMIEEALQEALQWAVFEPHDAALREKVAMAIYSFLERLWEQGALAGETSGEAFYIRCNESNNPPDAVADGRFLAEVGVAPVIPAEYIVFRIGRTEDVLETHEPEGGV